MNAKFTAFSWLTGVIGALACVVGMVLAIAGVATSAATVGMASMSAHSGMGTGESSGIVGWLVDMGPVTLIISIVAFAISAFSKRWSAILPAVIGGGVLYAGMYEQDSVAVMYWAIGVGFLLWVIAWAWASRWLPAPGRAAPVS